MATEHLAIDFQKFPQDQLVELSYVSQATHEMGMLSLMNLLEDAVHKNTKAKVTGVLFYDSGIFGQILEGYPAQLSFIWNSITADHRHKDIEILQIVPLQERRFATWAMKFYGSDEISKYVPELRVRLRGEIPAMPDEILTLMRSISNQSGEGFSAG